MLQLQFTQELKFKIVRREDEENMELKMAAMAVCFCCDAGQPKLVSILSAVVKFLIQATVQPTNQSPNFEKILFKDYTKNAHGHELQVSAQVHLAFAYSIVKRADR